MGQSRKHTSRLQACENDPQRRSRLVKILNVPQGHASGFDSPAALLADRFDKPAGNYSWCVCMLAFKVLAYQQSFSAAC